MVIYLKSGELFDGIGIEGTTVVYEGVRMSMAIGCITCLYMMGIILNSQHCFFKRNTLVTITCWLLLSGSGYIEEVGAGKMALTEIEIRVLPTLRMIPTTNIASGMRGQTLSVDPELRRSIFDKVLCFDLENIRERIVYVIKCDNIKSVISRDCVFSIIQSPTNCNSLKVISSMSDGPGFNFVKIFADYQLKLSNFEKVKKGSEFIIFNQSLVRLELCSLERKHPINNSPWLKSQEATFLRRGEKEWENKTRVDEIMTISVATNPLQRESGAVLFCNGAAKNYKNDGEYYLPDFIIKHILDKKIEKLDNDFKCYYCTSESNVDIDAAIKACENDTAIFVYESMNKNHTVAGCLRVVDDEVQCYVHETLGFDNVTRFLPGRIEERIKEAFPDKSVRILLPKETLQRDFYSCGVMAIKATMYFIKHPKFMDTVFKVPGGDREGDSLSFVNVKELPARMLKLCQFSAHLNDASLQKAKVNSKLSLHKYLKLYMREVPNHDGRNSVSVNAAAIAKRYKYFDSYFNSIGKSATLASSPVALAPLTKVNERNAAKELKIRDNKACSASLKRKKVRGCTSNKKGILKASIKRKSDIKEITDKTPEELADMKWSEFHGSLKQYGKKRQKLLKQVRKTQKNTNNCRKSSENRRSLSKNRVSQRILVKQESIWLDRARAMFPKPSDGKQYEIPKVRLDLWRKEIVRREDLHRIAKITPEDLVKMDLTKFHDFLKGFKKEKDCELLRQARKMLKSSNDIKKMRMKSRQGSEKGHTNK